MTVSDRIHLLLERYRNNSITSAEFDELTVWMEGLNEGESDQLLEPYKPLWEQAKIGQLKNSEHKVDWQTMLNNVMLSNAPGESKKNVRNMWWRAAAAAILILFSATTIYFLFNTGTDEKHVAQKENLNLSPEKVLPNVNQTVLTLPGGRQISLDSIASGNMIGDNQSGLMKLQDGEIAYNPSTASNALEYHTISVPRGGRTYKVILSDGSRIWLNAGSSLRYPSYFDDKERLVELTGEGYFEIAPRLRSEAPSPDGNVSGGENKTPFLVKLHNMTVEVLGTHFNIMSYEDEPSIETTLIEGSVKVTSGINTAILTPGKQAQLFPNGVLHMNDADTAMATAWVNGYFHFDKANTETIFRQIGRWYDLDIEYTGNIPSDLFSGKMERSLPLSGILKLFASSPIKIKVEGKKLIVMADDVKN